MVAYVRHAWPPCAAVTSMALGAGYIWEPILHTWRVRSWTSDHHVWGWRCATTPWRYTLYHGHVVQRVVRRDWGRDTLANQCWPRSSRPVPFHLGRSWTHSSTSELQTIDIYFAEFGCPIMMWDDDWLRQCLVVVQCKCEFSIDQCSGGNSSCWRWLPHVSIFTLCFMFSKLHFDFAQGTSIFICSFNFQYHEIQLWIVKIYFYQLTAFVDVIAWLEQSYSWTTHHPMFGSSDCIACFVRRIFLKTIIHTLVVLVHWLTLCIPLCFLSFGCFLCLGIGTFSFSVFITALE